MRETPEAINVLKKIRSYTEGIVGECYKDKNTSQLREFASLTSYPGSKAQCWHRDSTEKNATLMTAFMNLFETTQENGALQLIGETHRQIQWLEKINNQNIQTIELPEKSLILMDSRLIHRGGANRSKREIRPVLYASFGQGNLKDPGYYIHDELKGKYSLYL